MRKFRFRAFPLTTDATHVAHSYDLRCLDAKTHKGKVCYENKNCHIEDNSPKYHMVGKIILTMRSFACAQDDVLPNKTIYSLFTTHHSLIHTDTVFSRFTSHFSLKRPACATHVALCDSVGSYFRHWCAAFTLAEVLITLSIIGVVAAMTMPALIANTKKSEISAKLKKFNTTMAQCVLLSEQDNGPAEEWSNPGEYDTFDLDKFFKTYLAPYIKYSSAGLKTEYGSKRYYVYLLDGGYFYFVKGNCVDIVYDVNGSKKPNAHGRDIFRFLLCGSKSPEWCDGRHFCPMYSTSAHTREEKIQDCIKGDRGSGCTGLLEYDGWEFKKDYPIRL